ncbi:FtsX-like permease family protein [Spirillospora sp. CA-294931]|uniref:FtsX-like permease family protein n=1 Tax=Spirillospora sp. CA-294931 TaxID=3240042 RepID=UPI003D8DE78B
MANDRGLVLAACATVLFAATVLAALVGYSGSVTQEGLRRTLAKASPESAGTRLSGPVPPGGVAATQAKVDRALREIYREVPVTAPVAIRSDTFTLPGQEKKERPELTAFAAYSGIARHARLVSGRWPGRGAALEAVLPADAARAMRVSPGASLTLRGRIDRAQVVQVTVVGLFQVNAADDALWQGDRLVTTGLERGDYTTRGPLVVPIETFAAKFTGSGVQARWSVMPDLRGLSADGMVDLGRRVRGGGEVFEKSGPGFAAVTRLPELTEQLNGAVLVSRSTMLIPVLQLVMLAGYALVLVARLLADHRRQEIALLRMRGAAMLQLTGLTLAEGLFIVLPGALLAPLLAGPLLRALGWAPAVEAAGLRLDAGPLLPLFGISVAAALASAAVLTVPTLRGAGRSLVVTRTRRGASWTDAVLLIVAALALWQLSRYGGAPTTGAIDPVIVSGPAIALLAGGVLLLRLVPITSAAVERVASRGRGFAVSMGARQVSRSSIRHAGPALLLVMAMAVGVLSVTTMATWRQSQLDQADFRAGADLRLTVPDGGHAPSPMGRAGRLAALPDVTGVVGVRRQDATLGDLSVGLLAADVRALAGTLRVRPDLAAALRRADLASNRSPAPGGTFPGRPESLQFDVRATPEGQLKDDLQLDVTLADGRGLLYRVPLPAVKPDGRTRTVTLNAADLAGPGGVISYPLSVRGLHHSPDHPPAGRVKADLLGARGTGTGEAPLPQAARSAAPPSGKKTQPAVPGIVTRELADRSLVKVGGTVTLGTADGEQPVRIVAVVPALPSADPGRPALLVDLPDLAQRRLAAGSATADGLVPDEWWASARGDRAVRELASRPDLARVASDRAALRRELRDAPLGAALQGALVLGFAAALAFAVIAFVVSSAVAARERAREFAVLRALGVRGRQISGMLAVEQTFLVGLGLVGGLALGLLVARLVVGHIVLTVQAGAPYPPADLVVPWTILLAVFAAVAAVFGLLLAVLTRALRRRVAGEGTDR